MGYVNEWVAIYGNGKTLWERKHWVTLCNLPFKITTGNKVTNWQEKAQG